MYLLKYKDLSTSYLCNYYLVRKLMKERNKKEVLTFFGRLRHFFSTKTKNCTLDNCMYLTWSVKYFV